MSYVYWEQLAGVNIHYRLYPFEYFLDVQQKLGMKNIELWAVAPHFLLGYDGYQDCRQLRKQIEDRGLKVAAFTPESVTYPFPLCSWNQEIRTLALGYYTNAIRAAAELGAKVVPISCAGALKDGDSSQAVQWAVEALKHLAPIAQENEVVLAVETLCPDVSIVVNTLPELEQLLKAVDHPNVKATLDICSMRTAGETLEQWLQCLGRDIVHIHFTDGRPAGHLVWGQGLHPLDTYIETICTSGYQGYLGMNLSIRGTWFDPALVDEKMGFVGKEFVPENYWFYPAAADQKNLEAVSRYTDRRERSGVI